MTETEKREEILDTLQRNPDPEHLWECIIAFQDYHFETISGLPKYLSNFPYFTGFSAHSLVK